MNCFLVGTLSYLFLCIRRNIIHELAFRKMLRQIQDLSRDMEVESDKTIDLSYIRHDIMHKNSFALFRHLVSCLPRQHCKCIGILIQMMFQMAELERYVFSHM